MTREEVYRAVLTERFGPIEEVEAERFPTPIEKRGKVYRFDQRPRMSRNNWIDEMADGRAA